MDQSDYYVYFYAIPTYHYFSEPFPKYLYGWRQRSGEDNVLWNWKNRLCLGCLLTQKKDDALWYGVLGVLLLLSILQIKDINFC